MQVATPKTWTITAASMRRAERRQEKERTKNTYPQPEFPVFNEEPTFINGWDELQAYCEANPVDRYSISFNDCCADINSKDGEETIWLDKHCITNHLYLSTHTFYGHQHEFSTTMLQRCGWNVRLRNWDAPHAELTDTGAVQITIPANKL